MTALGAGRRRLVAPDGTTLVVRPVSPSDAPSLSAFYRSLPPADWVRHLGVADGKDRGFAAGVASIAERGGYGLVVELNPVPAARPLAGDTAVEEGRPAGAAGGAAAGAADATADAAADAGAAARGADAAGSAIACSLVGESHYGLLPGGHGELVLVVAPQWRDWLGPRLLDAILDDAAARGVVNVEVDVMRGDDWLLALLESRGYAVLPTDDWLSTRVVVGTAGCSPVWDADVGPRVLVEAANGHWHAAEAARDAGLAVLVCTAHSHRRAPCPLLEGTPCPLVTGADVVVVSYPPDRPEWDALIAVHRELHPDVPVCVEGREGQALPAGVVALDVHDPADVARRVAELASHDTTAGGDARR